MRKPIAFLSAISVLTALTACTEKLTSTGEASDITDRSATLTGYANLPLELGDAEVGIMYGEKRSFEDGRKIVAAGLDGHNSFSVTVIGLAPNTKYYYKSYVQNGLAVKNGAVRSFTTKKPQCPAGAVDLGIMMTREDGSCYTLYWAKSNLSDKGLCPHPEDYGDYYAWGETETKSDYQWDTYKSKYNTIISSGSVEKKTVFEITDDVAHVKLGGKWRLPTDAEWTALMTQCTWTWVTDYKGSGINGRLVTASNGSSIFLPAAGGRYNTARYNTGTSGNYWSSSLNTANPDSAWYIAFHADDADMYDYDRCYGFSVRPVSE
ncbi:MAG: hypothetical protein IK008_02035 [Bacteroidales bacterium]|nr:hypothetical protein [Bacteroidales bacterium]